MWRDLLKLKDGVRDENIYEDAIDVARETMRRVRLHIETFLDRLIDIGFVFGYDHRLLPPIATKHQLGSGISPKTCWLGYAHNHHSSFQQDFSQKR